MSSVFEFVIGLLQAALSLLGFVQVHPELPQPAKDQAQQVAQQAITQATQALSTNKLAANVSVQSEHGGILAAPAGSSATWQLTVTGSFSMQQDSYQIDFGDGVKENLICLTSSSSEPVCTQFKSVTHTFTQSGYYQIRVIANSRGLGSNTTHELLTTKVYADIGNTSQSSISVPGMTKYTDADFGFSFWYPSGWTVTSASGVAGTKDWAGNLLKGRIVIKGDGVEIDIDKSHSDERTYKVNQGACGYCGPLTYYFDTALHTWMTVHPDGLSGAPDATPEQMAASKAPKPADVSNNTMGGLHIFNTGQKESAAIIPLSARDFLYIQGVTYTQQCGSSCAVDGGSYVKGAAQFLAKTILATDPSVATPVSAAEQTATIQAEKKAYLNQ